MVTRARFERAFPSRLNGLAPVDTLILVASCSSATPVQLRMLFDKSRNLLTLQDYSETLVRSGHAMRCQEMPVGDTLSALSGLADWVRAHVRDGDRRKRTSLRLVSFDSW
jgi:hypothetical protein